jgi:glycosyltransferase involved in cell wall biosynthesis
MPTVAVIVATYDRAAYLEEAIRSVQQQTITDWECVVVDDGSTDDTRLQLAALAAREPRLRWLSLPHSGLHGQVRNAGIRASTAPLVAFLDDDDLWLPPTLARQVAALEKDGEAALAFGRMERFGAGRGLWPRERLSPRLRLTRLLQGNVIPLSTVMARRGPLEAAGLFPEDVEATPDYELWLRLARRHTLRALPEVLCRYRVHAGSISRRKPLEIEELDRLYARIEREWGVPPRLLARARRGLHRARARAAPSLRESLGHWARALRP